MNDQAAISRRADDERRLRTTRDDEGVELPASSLRRPPSPLVVRGRGVPG
jgi:hypothetical protein